MARVTQCEVKAIRPDIDSSLDIAPWIAAANCVVDTLSEGCGSGLTEAKLAQVELWLSAHYVGSLAPSVTSETFEGWSKSYNVGSTSETGILSDIYGRTANQLSGGCLRQLEKVPAFGCSV